MIVGSGQIAQEFEGTVGLSKFVIFASGVSNSSCVDSSEFKRERDLLTEHLTNLDGRKIVYFSSCALSASDYELNPYYLHKKQMEKLIIENTDEYYIFRVPQLFGDIKNHTTLINYLYNAIKREQCFTLNDGAYRYVIELSDLKKIVLEFIKREHSGQTLDVANNYRYSIFEIVNVIERLTEKSARYEVKSNEDAYQLDLSRLLEFEINTDCEFGFGKDYFHNKIKKHIK